MPSLIDVSFPPFHPCRPWCWWGSGWWPSWRNWRQKTNTKSKAINFIPDLFLILVPTQPPPLISSTLSICSQIIVSFFCCLSHMLLLIVNNFCWRVCMYYAFLCPYTTPLFYMQAVLCIYISSHDISHTIIIILLYLLFYNLINFQLSDVHNVIKISSLD